jgi:hypothetical protein
MAVLGRCRSLRAGHSSGSNASCCCVPGKRRREPESGPTTGSAIAAGKAIAFVADPKVGLRLGKALAADISSASGGMLEDVRREPYCFGGHEYKLFSDLVDETGEDREARIDREELALNGACLTLGMNRFFICFFIAHPWD